MTAGVVDLLRTVNFCAGLAVLAIFALLVFRMIRTVPTTRALMWAGGIAVLVSITYGVWEVQHRPETFYRVPMLTVGLFVWGIGAAGELWKDWRSSR